MRDFRHHEARLRGFAWRMPFPPPWMGPGGPHGPGGHHRGRGGRGRRPNVRAAVLQLLAERPMHGYEMITELETRTNGVWRPSPGSVYPTLQLLEDEGLIVSEETGGRRRFTLTDAGRAEAEAAGDSAPWDQFGDENVEDWHDLKEAALGAMNALRQVMMTGTDEQRRRAVEVIAETRRKLYAILAD
jgi:DNA-binding PadR family transcriptional regulator